MGKHISVILATQHLNEVRQVFGERLPARKVGWNLLGEPRSVAGIYGLVGQKPHLVVTDPPEQLLGPMEWALLVDVLDRGEIPHVLADEFLAQPDLWLERALIARGAIEALRPLTTAFVAYSGGVGKTTVTLDTALVFAQRTRLPVLIVEVCAGASALHVYCDQGLPDLYDCAAEGRPPGQWRGITVVPMNARHMANMLDEQIQEFLAAQTARHILTLVDGSQYPHRLLDLIDVNQWWIFADARRRDTVANALLLRQQRPDSHVVANWAGRLSLNTLGLPCEAQLPGVRRADRLGGQLGRRMLRHIYPGWRI